MSTPSFDAAMQRLAGYGKQMTLPYQAGLATFFRADWCPDWKQLDIALVGVPTDAGVIMRPGTRHGPREVRNQSVYVLHANPLTKVIPYELARVGDVGDVPLGWTFQLEKVIQQIHDFFASLRSAGLVPVAAGGDHAITYPILKALGTGRPLGLIHVDAHLDLTDDLGDTTLHHSAPFRNAVRDGVLDPKRTVHIGIRDPFREVQQPFADETGMTTLTIDDFYDRGIKGVIAEARRVVGNGPTYISFDIDVLDPAYAPGTGMPVVGGITSAEARRLLQGLRGLDIVGADVVEVSPPFDTGGITALAGAQMMFELLCLAAEAVAKRKG